jgi:hypothetical protein
MVVAWWLLSLWLLLAVRAERVVPQWLGNVFVPTDGASPVPLLDDQDAGCTCSEAPGKYVT